MNPDTKITNEQIKAICSKHNIPYRSHTRITTGFSHELHRINDDLVIKIFNIRKKDDSRLFKTELALLSSDAPFLKPNLIASDDSTDIIDRSYIIMTFVSGVSLGSSWHKASEKQREELIKTISRSLRNINQIDPQSLGFLNYEPWQEQITKRAEDYVIDLCNNKIIDDSTASNVRQTFNNNIVALIDSDLCPVYWDVHFDNFIVDSDFKLQAIIDLENVELAPLDYPLFVIQKMVDEPEKYLSEDNEKYANIKDYENLKIWYAKYYPEMFIFNNLENRVKLYQILDTLHLLKDWSHVKELHVKLNELIR